MRKPKYSLDSLRVTLSRENGRNFLTYLLLENELGLLVGDRIDNDPTIDLLLDGWGLFLLSTAGLRPISSKSARNKELMKSTKYTCLRKGAAWADKSVSISRAPSRAIGMYVSVHGK